MAGAISTRSSKDKTDEQAKRRSHELAHRPTQSGLHTDILALQRAVGNRTVSQLLKPEESNSAEAVNAVPPIVHEVLRSPGQPLDPATRALMESRFGYDFGQVRLHTDARAAESALALEAAAYTVGHDVVFGSGQYAPQSGAGRRLLAHEVAHVVQQQLVPPGLDSPPVNRPDDIWERSANAGADQLSLQALPSGPPPLVQRQTDPRHARGYLGEQTLGFVAYRYQDGWAVVRGPGGSAGHGVTAGGEDGLFFNVRTRELHITDNKAFAGQGRVYGATAIDPTRNLLRNLNDMIRHVESQSPQNLPMRQQVLRLLRQTRAAIRDGQRIPGRVRLIVANAAGRSTGVGARLQRLGVTFLDVSQPVVQRPGTARPSLGPPPQAPLTPTQPGGAVSPSRQLPPATAAGATPSRQPPTPGAAPAPPTPRAAPIAAPAAPRAAPGPTPPATRAAPAPVPPVTRAVPPPSQTLLGQRQQLIASLQQQTRRTTAFASGLRTYGRVAGGLLEVLAMVNTVDDIMQMASSGTVLPDAQRTADRVRSQAVVASRWAQQVYDSISLLAAMAQVSDAITRGDTQALFDLSEALGNFGMEVVNPALEFQRLSRNLNAGSRAIRNLSDEFFEPLVTRPQGLSTAPQASALAMHISLERLSGTLGAAADDYGQAGRLLQYLADFTLGLASRANRTAWGRIFEDIARQWQRLESQRQAERQTETPRTERPAVPSRRGFELHYSPRTMAPRLRPRR